MKHFIRATVVTACLLIHAACFAGGEVAGSWADRGDTNIYSFDPEGNFGFYSRLPAAADNGVSGATDPPPSYKVRRGVYSQGKDICHTLQQKGNLMIYVEEVQCCMMAQEIAGKLVLTEVFSKDREDASICKDRVLHKIEILPSAREE